jgi:hypothetical protein
LVHPRARSVRLLCGAFSKKAALQCQSKILKERQIPGVIGEWSNDRIWGAKRSRDDRA